MQAMIYESYGSPDVLELREIAKPVVKHDEILIKVHAASVTPLDWHFLTGKPYIARLMAGVLKPKRRVLGTDMAGVVEAVGASVTNFQPGDSVFGLSFHSGAFARYLCVSESHLALVEKPASISYEHAAAIPYSGSTALICLRDLGRLQAGQHVLINGASGGTGTFAVQIAKSMGATVTGVCSSRNLERVRSIGADHVIDYTVNDFVSRTSTYDLVIGIVRKRTFAECKDALKPCGIYVTTEFSPSLLLQSRWASMTGDKRLLPLPMKRPTAEDLSHLSTLIEKGSLEPVVDRRYPLRELPEALCYIGNGHARGKIIIEVA